MKNHFSNKRIFKNIFFVFLCTIFTSFAGDDEVFQDALQVKGLGQQLSASGLSEAALDPVAQAKRITFLDDREVYEEAGDVERKGSSREDRVKNKTEMKEWWKFYLFEKQEDISAFILDHKEDLKLAVEFHISSGGKPLEGMTSLEYKQLMIHYWEDYLGMKSLEDRQEAEKRRKKHLIEQGIVPKVKKKNDEETLS